MDEWYKSGKPTEPTTSRPRFTPLGVAIERGFHSLVEVLLRHSVQPTGKALYEALRYGRADLVELLLQHGADANSVRFEYVIDSHDPQMLRMFIERGADLVTDYPIAEGFKTAIKPMLGIYKTYVEKFPEFKFQANIALRRFCRQGSMRGVCLLLWAGADARAKVPEEYGEEEEMWQSALREAAWNGHVEIMEKIGPDPTKDNLNELLYAACFSGNEHMVRYVIGLGADPNAAECYGETALAQLVSALSWAVNPVLPGGCNSAEDAIQCLKTFVELGGKWNEQQPRQLSYFRSCLYRLAPGAVLDLIAFFKKHNFCSDEVIIKLLNTPKMREHLRQQYRFKGLHNLVPFFRKWIPREGRR